MFYTTILSEEYYSRFNILQSRCAFVRAHNFHVQGNSLQPISIRLVSKCESSNHVPVRQAYSKHQNCFPAMVQSSNRDGAFILP